MVRLRELCPRVGGLRQDRARGGPEVGISSVRKRVPFFHIPLLFIAVSAACVSRAPRATLDRAQTAADADLPPDINTLPSLGFPLATDKALVWLKNHQLADGYWSGEGPAQSKTAMTGLALLAFLSQGETPASEQYGPAVLKAIRFLVEQDWQGERFRHEDATGYAHGIATLALCEAYDMTRLPEIRKVTEAAVARIVKGQQESGAFNYRLIATDTRRDVSLSGWMAQALAAAWRYGLKVEGLKAALDRAPNAFLQNYDAGRRMFAYAASPAQRDDQLTGRRSITAIAVFALQDLGRGAAPEAKVGLAAVRETSASYTEPGDIGSHPIYTRYYATRALLRARGPEWWKWFEELYRSYQDAQNPDGSWTARSAVEQRYGDVYATAFSTISLNTPYGRRLPLPSWEPTDETEDDSDDVKIEVTP